MQLKNQTQENSYTEEIELCLITWRLIYATAGNPVNYGNINKVAMTFV